VLGRGFTERPGACYPCGASDNVRGGVPQVWKQKRLAGAVSGVYPSEGTDKDKLGTGRSASEHSLHSLSLMVTSKTILRRLRPIAFLAFTAAVALYLLTIPLFGIAPERRYGAAEAVLAGTLLLLSSGIAERLSRISLSGTGVELELSKVIRKQDRQQKEIEVLSFLVSHFLPKFEIEHLEKLAGPEPFPYHRHGGFEHELRRLWSLSLITKKKEFQIADMPSHGDLHEFFDITGQGRRYLELRKEMEMHRIRPQSDTADVVSNTGA
jgi:hypothetical protein